MVCLHQSILYHILYMHIYIYICFTYYMCILYIYACIYTHTHLCVYMYICIYIYIYSHTYSIHTLLYYVVSSYIIPHVSGVGQDPPANGDAARRGQQCRRPLEVRQGPGGALIIIIVVDNNIGSRWKFDKDQAGLL